ncbi:MAG TPA: fatty acid desaturase [Polyangium sp.]|nr:fatty acid desaturase [Polyangium sp.]
MVVTTSAPEPPIERALRRFVWVIPLLTVGTSALLLGLIWLAERYFAAGHSWIVIVSGLLTHAVMVVGVHDGAHRAITKTSFDRWFCSLIAGLLLLPLYGEAFRRYHLLHHAQVNGPHDPLYLPSKAKLFEKNRIVYMVLDVIPLLLAFVCKQTQTAPEIKAPPFGLRYMIAGLATSAVVVYFVRPSIPFVLLNVFSLYAWASIRDWCEHFGTDESRVANAYFFPLGMGIGNHEAHHQWPHFSWLTMELGLWKRKIDTDPLRAAVQMATNPRFRHYTATGDVDDNHSG